MSSERIPEHFNQEAINETIKREKEVEIEATDVDRRQTKALGDGNSIAWFNSAAQSARGSKVNITWTYLPDAKRSLHDCLIRFTLSRTADGRSNLIEPQFTKRSDSKSAVTLLAISQNVGGWITAIEERIENLLLQDTKQQAYSLPFDHEKGAVGCAFRVEFDPSLWREYTVPVQYRTRLEDRLAAVLQACEESILKFIWFEDKTPLPGYIRDSWRTKRIRGPHDIKIEKPRYKEGEDGWQTTLVSPRKRT
ncbi:hypothetical protein CPB86DRAFT_810349 [Serendipita vermifera]|nr:hypothetical protein CPB86DRAFT_810349 [Serendipita vermifera]